MLLPLSLALLIMLVGVFAGVQLLRQTPPPEFDSAMSAPLHLPGASPSLPWPTAGSAALAMVGMGSLGAVGSTNPVPVASITKVMVAYIVLKDHPLSPGTSGPAIPVTADTIAAYQTGLATEQSVVAVAAGETLTEIQALEGLLLPSGNNIATMLAEWDAGTTTAFVAKMNSTAQSLGLTSTHFTDVSGLDPSSVSTPADLIRLGQVAMTIPAFTQIVAMGQATLPVAGVVYNFDYALGHDGIIGIKTGSDSAAGGCFLFEAQRTIDGTKVTLVGAVLGQQTRSPLTAALDTAEDLANAAFASVTSMRVLPTGTLVGKIMTRWGAAVTVAADPSPTLIGWPGLPVTSQLDVRRLPAVVAAGTRLGVLEIDIDGRHIDIAVHATRSLPGPSVLWRLKRI